MKSGFWQKKAKWKSFENLFRPSLSCQCLIEWLLGENKMSTWCCCVVLSQLVPDDGMTFILDMISSIIWPVPFFCLLYAFSLSFVQFHWRLCSAFVTLAYTWSVWKFILICYRTVPIKMCDLNSKKLFRFIVYSFFWFGPSLYISFSFTLPLFHLDYPIMDFCSTTIDNEKWKQISFHNDLSLSLYIDLFGRLLSSAF